MVPSPASENPRISTHWTGHHEQISYHQSVYGSMHVAGQNLGLLQGNLDVIVLKTLSWQPMHGFGIARWIQNVTDERLQVEEGSLYPALYRLENKGLIKSEWRMTENNRRAKYYRLTPAGKRQLSESAETWNTFVLAMSKILNATQTS